MTERNPLVDPVCPRTGTICEGRIFLADFRNSLDEALVGIEVDELEVNRRHGFLRLLANDPHVRHQDVRQAHIRVLIRKLETVLQTEQTVCEGTLCGPLAEFILALASEKGNDFGYETE